MSIISNFASRSPSIVCKWTRNKASVRTIGQSQAAPCLNISNNTRESITRWLTEHNPHVQSNKLIRHLHECLLDTLTNQNLLSNLLELPSTYLTSLQQPPGVFDVNRRPALDHTSHPTGHKEGYPLGVKKEASLAQGSLAGCRVKLREFRSRQ